VDPSIGILHLTHRGKYILHKTVALQPSNTQGSDLLHFITVVEPHGICRQCLLFDWPFLVGKARTWGEEGQNEGHRIGRDMLEPPQQ